MESVNAEIETSKEPMAYREAVELATRNAKSDSASFGLRLPFFPSGLGIGEPADNTRLYDFGAESAVATTPSTSKTGRSP